MTKLYFVRHAESDNTIKEDFYRPLTISGILSAKKIPEAFSNIPIDLFYSSPFVRSVHTIQYLANQHDKKIIPVPNFKERRVGSWVDDFLDFTGKQWNDFDYKLDDGESLNDVQKRNIEEIKRILVEHKDMNIVIGTHGTALCTILNYYNSQYDFKYFKSIAKEMPLLIEMQFDGMSLVDIKDVLNEIIH